MNAETEAGETSQAAVAAAIEGLERDGETGPGHAAPPSTDREPNAASDLFVFTKAAASKRHPSRNGARQVEVEAAVRRMEAIEAGRPLIQAPFSAGDALTTAAQASSALGVVLLCLVVVVAMTTGGGGVVAQQTVTDLVGTSSAVTDAVGGLTAGGTVAATAPVASAEEAGPSPEPVWSVSDDGTRSEGATSERVRTTAAADTSTSTDSRLSVTSARTPVRTDTSAERMRRGRDDSHAPSVTDRAKQNAVPGGAKPTAAANRGRAAGGDASRATVGGKGSSDATRAAGQPAVVARGDSDARPNGQAMADATRGAGTDARPFEDGDAPGKKTAPRGDGVERAANAGGATPGASSATPAAGSADRGSPANERPDGPQSTAETANERQPPAKGNGKENAPETATEPGVETPGEPVSERTKGNSADRGNGPVEARDKPPATERGTETMEARGNGPAADRGNGMAEARGNETATDRGNETVEDHGTGPSKDRGTGPATERGNETATDRGNGPTKAKGTGAGHRSNGAAVQHASLPVRA